MIYEMKLNTAPFEKIKSGTKTVELRLYDEKRSQLNIGDRIIFTDLNEPDRKIAVIIKSLHRYGTFEDLFNDLPLEKCGNDITESPKSAAAKMEKYYTCEQIRKYGVLGIEIEITDLEETVKDLEEYIEEYNEKEFEKWFPDGMK